MFIDTHAHLIDSKLKDRLDEVVNNAKNEGIEKIIGIGCTIKEAKEMIDIAERYDGVFATAGLYPHKSEDQRDISDADLLAQLAAVAKTSPKIIAIGECGLDFSKPPPWEVARTPQDQEALFRSQIQIARELNLPIIIHSRKAREDTLRIVENEMTQNKFAAVWHCFSENKSTTSKALDLGLMLSFTSVFSPEVVKEVPLEKIMIETDAPYLVPQEAKANGITVNEPRYVKMIASKIADIIGVSIDEVAKITTKNALDFFHLNSHD